MAAKKLPAGQGVTHELARYLNDLVDEINKISGLNVLDGGTASDSTASSDSVIDGGDATG